MDTLFITKDGDQSIMALKAIIQQEVEELLDELKVKTVSKR